MAYTSPAIVAQRKCVTRRQWSPKYAPLFHRGTRAMAWSRQAQYGGERIAELELTRDPRLENIQGADPEEVYVTEGFQYLDDPQGSLLEATRRWARLDQEYWVVQFKVTTVLPGMLEKYTTMEMIARARASLLRFLPGEGSP